MNYLNKPYQDFDDYCLDHYGEYFDLDVRYIDTYYNNSVQTVNALEVYKHLKEYFKGTPHE